MNPLKLPTRLFASASTPVPVPAPSLAPAAVVLTLQQRVQHGAASHVVLFKKHAAADGGAAAIAWKVVRCSAAQDVRVLVPFSQQIGVLDGGGRHAGIHEAPAGALLRIGAADQNGHACATLEANTVGVRNDTADTPLTVLLYKDGRPLLRHGALVPGATVLFDVLPYLYVARCSAMAEGAILDAATVAAATRISLLGLHSAVLGMHDQAGHAAFSLRQQRFG